MSNKNQSSIFSKLKTLPALKSTIKVIDGGFDFWHDRVWILHDVIENKYFYLGRLEYEIITRWQLEAPTKIIDAVNNETVFNIDNDNIESVFNFLLASNLLVVSNKVINHIKEIRSTSFITSLQKVGKLFFLRIPIINPNNFLDKTVNVFKLVFSKQVSYAIFIIFLVNVFMLASNWGSFTGKMPPLTDVTSLILIMITLLFTKVAHELGHAYACKMYGGKVPEMGVTFIFFYPLFYTDVSSSMTFRAQKRLVVSTAGIRVELYLAVLAGFLWFFVTEQTIIKNLLFFIATISWLVSIAFNIVPFIKFDGYYILSDYLKIRNLGPRATAIFKYYFRKYAFGVDASSPELYNQKKFKFFLFFAVLTGLYKIILFTSIFLFLFYIEIIGVALFSIALVTMLAIPISREIYNIWRLREKIKDPQTMQVTGAITAIVLLLLLMPIRNNIYMPTVIFAKTQRIYAPIASQLNDINIELGKEVKAGDKLLTLYNPELDNKKVINMLNLETEKYYSLGARLSSEYRKEMLSQESDLEYQRAVEKSIKLKAKQLEILAPFSGTITAIREGIYKDIWLEDKAWIFDVVDFSKYYLHAFIQSNDVNEVDLSNATDLNFIPNRMIYPGCKVNIKSISNQPISRISCKPEVPLELAESTLLNSNLLFFSSEYGGDINFEKSPGCILEPVDSYFTLELTPDYENSETECFYDNKQIVKGVLKLRSSNKSLIVILYEKIRNALTRLKT